MKNPSFLGTGLMIGFLLLGLFLLHIYYIQPHLALKIEAPVPLPTIEEMPTPAPGKQVATTMSLIKALAREKRQSPEKSNFHPRRVLRNPFIDQELLLEKERVKQVEKSGEAEMKTALPLVQMVMIGEYQNSALLDNVLVKEGDFYKSLQIQRIVESGVYVKDREKSFKLPLGAFATASLPKRRPKFTRKSESQSHNPSASVKERAAFSEFLHRLQPLFNGATGSAPAELNSGKSKKTSEDDGV